MSKIRFRYAVCAFVFTANLSMTVLLVSRGNAAEYKVEAKGVNVVRLTDTEKQAFKKATQKVYDKWAKTIGPELVKKAEQSIATRK